MPLAWWQDYVTTVTSYVDPREKACAIAHERIMPKEVVETTPPCLHDRGVSYRAMRHFVFTKAFTTHFTVYIEHVEACVSPCWSTDYSLRKALPELPDFVRVSGCVLESVRRQWTLVELYWEHPESSQSDLQGFLFHVEASHSKPLSDVQLGFRGSHSGLQGLVRSEMV
jgi:hypothetical protein